MYRVACLILIIVFSGTFSRVSYSGDSAKSNIIIIPLNNWSSQRVLSQVVGNLIKKMGRKVVYQNISANDQWGALRKGIVHLQIEVWQPSMAQPFTEMLENQFIVDLGKHSAVVREDWWYPDYVEEKCPDLPKWRAINHCAHLFASDENINQGVYYTGPWDYGDADLIRALNLKFVIKRLADDKNLWRQLKAATSKRQPIMLLNWTPNWTDVRLQGKFVEFPEYTTECESDPSWGENKNLAKDCGNPIKGWLKKAGWTGLEKASPCIYQLMKRIDLNNEMIAEASALIIADGFSEAEAAKRWMFKYQNTIEEWLNFTCQQGISH